MRPKSSANAARSALKDIHDSGICTACDLGRYYSYRAEKGKTGRMLAMIGLHPTIRELDEEMFAFNYECSSNSR